MGLFPYKLGRNMLKGPENDNPILVAIKRSIQNPRYVKPDIFTMVKSCNYDISKNKIQVIEYLWGISFQDTKKTLNAFNPDILTYNHRVTPAESQLKFTSFHLLHDLCHMLEFIAIQHVNFFYFYLIHLLTWSNLTLTQFFLGVTAKTHQIAAITVI